MFSDSQEPSAPEKKLICFDVDLTLTNKHFHDFLLNQSWLHPYKSDNGLIKDFDKNSTVKKENKYDPNAVREEAKKLLGNPETGIKNKEEISEKIVKLLNDPQYDVAFTSFSKYPHAVVEIENKILENHESLRGKIIYALGFPSYMVDKELVKKFGKTEHIDYAMEQARIPKDDYHQVALIDDDPKNIEAAKELKVVAILVDDTKEYLNKIDQYLEGKLKSDEKKINSEFIQAYKEMKENISQNSSAIKTNFDFNIDTHLKGNKSVMNTSPAFQLGAPPATRGNKRPGNLNIPGAHTENEQAKRSQSPTPKGSTPPTPKGFSR